MVLWLLCSPKFSNFQLLVSNDGFKAHCRAGSVLQSNQLKDFFSSGEYEYETVGSRRQDLSVKILDGYWHVGST